MDLKFSFGASNPLPLASEGAGSASAGAPGSSVLELRVSLSANGRELVCEGVSGDGVAYASASRSIGAAGSAESAGSAGFAGSAGSAGSAADEDPAALAAALRSVLARGGAELPEPLLDSVSAVVLSLGGREAEVLSALGLTVSGGGAVGASSGQLAAIDESLQARTGIAAGTPIRSAK